MKKADRSKGSICKAPDQPATKAGWSPPQGAGRRGTQQMGCFQRHAARGGMAERLKAAVLKTVVL